MAAERVMGRWQRFRRSDLFYSFVRSPVTVLAAVVALVCIVGAVFAPVLAPHTPFDPASLEIDDAYKPPAWVKGDDAKGKKGGDLRFVHNR